MQLMAQIQKEEPKSITDANGWDGLWELAKEEYPPDKIAHFFYLIIYLTAFYGLLHLLTHLLNVCFNNKRYLKMKKETQGEYRG